MRDLTLAFWMFFIFGITCTKAQCTLDYTYAEVQSNYSSKHNLVNWQERKSDNGTVVVRYDEDGTDISYSSFMVNGRVVMYCLMGNADTHANEWGGYANTHFASQKYGEWIDYATHTRWTLSIKENVLAVFEAVVIKD